MKKIFDKDKIEEAIMHCKYADTLRALDIPLFLIEYKAGETLSSPILDYPYFQIVISGTLSIYFIRDDGTMYSLSTGGEGYILGEMDLFIRNKNNVFAESTGKLTTIACDTSLYRRELLDNNAFLRFAALTMADKIEAITNTDAVYSTLQERVLNYIRYKCDNGILKGVEKAAFKLHCSPRQLQRILNDYTADNIMQKIGKGTYRLNTE